MQMFNDVLMGHQDAIKHSHFLSFAEEGNSSCWNVQHNILASVNFLNIFLSKFLMTHWVASSRHSISWVKVKKSSADFSSIFLALFLSLHPKQNRGN